MAPSLQTRRKNRRHHVPARTLSAFLIMVAVLGAGHVALAQPGAADATRTISDDDRLSNATSARVSLRPRGAAARLAGRGPVEYARAHRSAQCASCEGEVLEHVAELVSDDGIPVTLSGNQVVIVSYYTSDGEAKAGEDYRAITDAALTFTPTELQPLIQVETFEDTLNESDETFRVTLLPADLPNGGRTDRLDPTLTIFDNDGLAAALSASTSTLEEGAMATFAVELTGGTSTEPVVIGYEVAAGSTVTAGADYTEPEGTLTIGTGRVRGTFTIRTHDDDLLERAETLTVRLPEECCRSAGRVTPSESQAAAEVTITDNDSVTISMGSATPGTMPATAREGEPIRFVVKLSGPVPNVVEVSYATRNGSGSGAALAGRDYTATRGRLRFVPDGALTQTISVATTDDSLNEATETFTVTLTGPDLPARVSLTAADATATGAIEDNDGLTAAVRAEPENVAEGETARFLVELTGGTSTAAVEIGYSVAGTATENRDYAPAGGRLTIGAGAAHATITMATRSDELDESEETLVVTLDSARSVGAVTVDPRPATAHVVDPRAMTIAPAEAAEGDGKIEFEVRLAQAGGVQVTVGYRTEDGTAEAGADYLAAAGTVTVGAGETSATLTITLIDDTLDEADRETFTVRLSDPVAANLLADPTAVGSIRDDDAPPAVSVADARAGESAGEVVFPVRLMVPSGRSVEVSYRTADGTATARADYKAAAGTLTLAAGQTRATIAVRVVHDNLEEPDETFRVRLSGAVHGELAAEATGTIVDDDVAVERVWLARFGRTVTAHVVDAVADRLAETTRQPPPGTVAAQRHDLGVGGPGTVEFRDLVGGSSFRLASGSSGEAAVDDGAHWSGWGGAAATRLAGEEAKAEMSLKGAVVTGAAGADYDWGPVLAGLALAYSGAGASYLVDAKHLHSRDGTAGSWMLSAHPYARVMVIDRLSVWGALGYGLGGMTLTEDGSVDTGIRMMMAALGVRGSLLTPAANDGFEVTIAADGFVMRANADAAAGQPAVEADAVRGRLVAEGSFAAQLGEGSVLTPAVEAGVRYDAGHAEEGLGAELGGGLRYVKPDWGLTATANGRFVLVHQERDFQEWGLRGSLRLSPGPAGRGPALAIGTSWGGPSASGMQHLWAQGAAPRWSGQGAAAPAAQLEAELGYGVGVNLVGHAGLLTPYAGVALGDGGAQVYRAGGRVDLGRWFSFGVEVASREAAAAAPAHSLVLRGSAHW